MIALTPRKVTISTTATNICDTTIPRPVTRVIKYLSGGNAIALGGSGVTYANGYPLTADVDFEDRDSSAERYAITDAGTQDLYIQEYRD